MTLCISAVGPQQGEAEGGVVRSTSVIRCLTQLRVKVPVSRRACVDAERTGSSLWQRDATIASSLGCSGGERTNLSGNVRAGTDAAGWLTGRGRGEWGMMRRSLFLFSLLYSTQPPTRLAVLPSLSILKIYASTLAQEGNPRNRAVSCIPHQAPKLADYPSGSSG